MKGNMGLTTAQNTAPVLESEGDILNPLRKIMERYVKRAEYLQHLGYWDSARNYCGVSAARVNLLIQQ